MKTISIVLCILFFGLINIDQIINQAAKSTDQKLAYKMAGIQNLADNIRRVLED